MSAAAPVETIPIDRHTYEDPFLDMASTKLPKSFKKLLELCQIFAMTHPQISPIIQRLAEYPITSLTYKGDEEAERQHREIFEKRLRIMEKMVEWGLDYFGYGNCFVSISFPFVRLYRCLTCETDHQTREIKYRYAGSTFQGECKSCKTERHFKPIDQYVKDPSGINLFRLEPQLITPKYNRVTGRYIYYYDIAPETVRSVESGDRDIIDGTPTEYLDCIRLKRKMRLKRVFHFKRPTLSGRDMQWGFPLVLPALKDAYLNQIYKKADEAVALEHSVPLRVVYPEPRTQDPMQKLALGNFKNFMSRTIRYWRRDKNAIITSPIPIGSMNIGGDAAQYSTINARVRVVDEIMGAMMVTRGFVLGGENWSSASISQRVMENSFLNYLRRIDTCLQWVRDEVAAFLGLPPCAVAMKPFKKVDDVQMLQLIIQLAQQKRISWEEALSRLDLDARQELSVIEKETVAYTDLMVQELMAQSQASAKAMVSQAAAQDEAQGVTELLQGQALRASGVRAEIEGKAKSEDFMQQRQQEQAQAAAQDPTNRKNMAQAARDEALSEAHLALAARRGGTSTAQKAIGLTNVAEEAEQQQQQAAEQEQAQQQQQQQQPQPQRMQMVDVDLDAQIQMWAEEILAMPTSEARDMLRRMHAHNPEVSQAVVERAQQIEQGSVRTSQGGRPAIKRSGNAKAMMRALVDDAKNPDDLASKITMLDARQQMSVMSELQRANPQLWIKIMKAVNKSNQEQQSNGMVVDMRPMPEQKPPRREESTV